VLERDESEGGKAALPALFSKEYISYRIFVYDLSNTLHHDVERLMYIVKKHPIPYSGMKVIELKHWRRE
jgi:hypothetical protein